MILKDCSDADASHLKISLSKLVNAAIAWPLGVTSPLLLSLCEAATLWVQVLRLKDQVDCYSLYQISIQYYDLLTNLDHLHSIVKVLLSYPIFVSKIALSANLITGKPGLASSLVNTKLQVSMIVARLSSVTQQQWPINRPTNGHLRFIGLVLDLCRL